MIHCNGLYRVVQTNKSDETTVLYVGFTLEYGDAHVAMPIDPRKLRMLPAGVKMVARTEEDRKYLRARVEEYAEANGYKVCSCGASR